MAIRHFLLFPPVFTEVAASDHSVNIGRCAGEPTISTNNNNTKKEYGNYCVLLSQITYNPSDLHKASLIRVHLPPRRLGTL